MFPLTNKEPYIKSSGERTTLGDMFAQAGGDISELEQEVDELSEALSDEVETRAALGAHNLLNNTAATQELNGVTFTKNSDGSVTISGKATSTFSFHLNDETRLDAGTYIFSNGNVASPVCFLRNAQAGINVCELADGKEKSFSLGNSTTLQANVYIVNGTTYNTTIYPMIRLATDSDPTYQPYAPTNYELGNNKANKKDLASISITGTTNSTGSTIASGIYFYLNGTLVRAKTSIANGATLTANTNYVAVPDGGLVELAQAVPVIEFDETAFTDGNEKVNFTKTFSAAPTVIAMPKYTAVTNGETPLLLKVYDVTTTYFRVRAIDPTGANVSSFTNVTSFMWQAMG